MAKTKWKLLVGSTFAIFAVLLIFWEVTKSYNHEVNSDGIDILDVSSRQLASAVKSKQSAFEKEVSYSRFPAESDGVRELPQPLSLPVQAVEADGLGAPANAAAASPSPRQNLSDDNILALGGVVPVAAKPTAHDDKTTRQKSMNSEDWKGEANLLVNALRAGEGFEVNHDQLLAFISGKDLLGWPEGLRNWIGDELMTALRQDMPQSAFGDLKSIVENTAAPAAMRDYSVQHISHLMTSGVLGQEGADFIWQTLEKNDPQTLSTALISLHRLSEQVPDHVGAKQVQAAAERLRESPDERTRISAESILKK